MSFILNALKKSEQQRQASQDETLETKILQDNELKQHKTPVWVILLIIVNVILISYFVWVFSMEDGEKEDVISVTSEQAVIPQKNEQKPKAKDLFTAVDEPEKIIEKNSQLPEIKTEKKQLSISEQLKRKQLLKQTALKEVQNKKIAPLAQQKKQPVSETKPVEEVKQLEESKQVEEEIVKEVKPATNTKKVVRDNNKEKSNEPPFLSELSYDFRRNVPNIDINVFVYTENKGGRFIMINMRKYVSGQLMDMGIKLKEIRMGSIVVEYKNKTFRIKR